MTTLVIGQTPRHIQFGVLGVGGLVNVVDLFCGVGGFSEGFKQEGFNVLLGVDSVQDKLVTYYRNIKPKHRLQTDICKLTGWHIKKLTKHQPIDIVIGSPPCRDFSASIRGRDFVSPAERQSLPYHFFRLVVALKPKWFIMENVEGYFRTVDGELLSNAFTPYGYHVSLHVLNALDFGVPQNRIRGFLIGNTIGASLQFEPVGSTPITIKDAIGDLEGKESDGDIEVQLDKPQGEYQRDRRNESNTVRNHYPTNHSEAVVSRLANVKSGQSWTETARFSGAYRRPYYGEPARTITSRYDVPTGDGESVHPILNRCFTPREAARLQSFDDSFVFIGSKVELRLQIGDAVPPLISRAIAHQVKLHMRT